MTLQSNEENEVLIPSNLMFNTRVVRGNTYSAQILPGDMPMVPKSLRCLSNSGPLPNSKVYCSGTVPPTVSCVHEMHTCTTGGRPPVTNRHPLLCSKKALKLKQSVAPPRTPEAVDGRRHIELQVYCTPDSPSYTAQSLMKHPVLCMLSSLCALLPIFGHVY